MTHMGKCIHGHLVPFAQIRCHQCGNLLLPVAQPNDATIVASDGTILDESIPQKMRERFLETVLKKGATNAARTQQPPKKAGLQSPATLNVLKQLALRDTAPKQGDLTGATPALGAGERARDSAGETLKADTAPNTSDTMPPAGADTFGFASADIQFSQVDWGRAKKRLEERYNALAELTKGGMGQILLVQERLSGRPVALKVMREEAATQDPLVQQFVREAIITARLQHVNVIPVYDIGFLSGNELYYTMRYIEGKPLSSCLREKAFDVPGYLRIVRGAALALHHAHCQGLWHRDLKPDNILIGNDGDAYVIDWGLVSVQPGRKYELNLPRIELRNRVLEFKGIDRLFERTSNAVTTRTGLLAGTLSYMAPEQVNSLDAHMGHRSDIWALGVILYECIYGAHPFLASGQSAEQDDGINRYALMNAICFSSPEFYGRATASVSSDLADLCAQMLSRDYKDRPETLLDVASALARIAEHRGPVETSLSGRPSPESPLLTLEAAEHDARLRERDGLLRELFSTPVYRVFRRRDILRRLARTTEM